PELEPQLHEMQQTADRWCRERFNGLLTLNLDWSVTLRGWDFYLSGHQQYAPAERKTFSTVLQQVQQALEKKKRQKLHSVFVGADGKWRDSEAFLLSERYERYQQEGKCETCGEEPAEPGEEEGMKIGAYCRDLRELGRDLLDDPALVWDAKGARI